MHVHLGPAFKAISLAAAKKSGSSDSIETCFEENPFDASLQKSTDWARRCIVLSGNSAGAGSSSGGISLEVPKSDIFADLPVDITAKLVSPLLLCP